MSLVDTETISALLDKLHLEVTKACNINSRACTVERSWEMAAKIDDCRARLSEVATALNVLRNSFLPVNRLPPEILANIFHHQHHASAFRPSAVDFPLMTDILTTSHVCHLWRQTALLFPSVWSTIHLKDEAIDLPEKFLQRSGQIPLRIYFTREKCPRSLTHSEAFKFYKFLASQSHRFVECHITISSVKNPLNLSALLEHPAPALESLSLRIPELYENSTFPMFAGHMPNLRKLALSNGTLWRGDLPNLTHLSLHNQIDTDPHTLAEFLRFLKGSPMLEELVMIDSGPGQEDDFALDPIPLSIPLNHLYRLEIAFWHYSAISNFLSCLVIPSSAELCFWECEGDGDTRTAISTIFRVGSQPWHNLSRITRIEIRPCYYGPPPIISIQGSRMVISGVLTINECLPDPTWFHGSSKEILVCESLPSIDLRVEDYTEIFKRMLPIGTLILCGVDLVTVMQAMDIVHGNVDPEEDPQSIIPKAFWDCYPNAHKFGAKRFNQHVISKLQRYIPKAQLMMSCPPEGHLHCAWPTPEWF